MRGQPAMPARPPTQQPTQQRLSLLLLAFVASILVVLAQPTYAADSEKVQIDDIHTAVRYDLPEAIEAHLKDINKIGPGGQTPLMHAVLQGKFKAAEYLLQKGADVNIGEKDGYTPMHGAGFQGRAEIATLLAKHGLDPSDRHSDGYTPIHRACWGREDRHSETVQALLDAGVSPNEPTKDGRTPLQLTKNSKTKSILEAAVKREKKNKKKSKKSPSDEI
mmetsp:Transcript_78580/g.163275  ORF Transcript_78580/g.163275 Transcript_78580/m.163275 type:complete len:220 (-) Transcript_78580:76-735(-)